MLIEEWNPNSARPEDDLLALAGVLHAAVHAGASVSFILPFSLDDARAFWIDKVLPGVSSVRPSRRATCSIASISARASPRRRAAGWTRSFATSARCL